MGLKNLDKIVHILPLVPLALLLSVAIKLTNEFKAIENLVEPIDSWMQIIRANRTEKMSPAPPDSSRLPLPENRRYTAVL